MSDQLGKAKAATWDWAYLENVPPDEALYQLSDRDIQALLVPLTQMGWSTRWFNRPTDFSDVRDFVAVLQEKLLTPIDLCQLIADCLTDPQSPAAAALRDGVSGYLRDNGINPGEKPSSAARTLDLSDGSNPDCDLDVLWAQCLQVVQWTNGAIIDMFEKIETATNVGEVAQALTFVPVLDEFGFDAIASYLQYLLEVVPEQYDAGYTQEVEYEIACELFCAAKETCELSIDALYNIAASRVGTSLGTALSFEDLVAFLAGFPTDTPLLTVNAMFFVAWGGLAAIGVVLDNLGDKALRMVIQLAADEPSSDWELLCDECSSDVWEQIFDLTVALAPVQIYLRGTWVAGQGVVSQPSGAGSQDSGIWLPLPSTTIIYTEVTVIGGNATVYNNFTALEYSYENAIPSSGATIPNPNPGTGVAASNFEYTNAGNFRAIFQLADMNRITRLVLRGRGVNPFA